ncbi:MAG TPA: hypothetical protein P5268_10655 [Candidatus Marinimicrobia bacterium]|nr:hypothetical protein [Candidatus Neomarinimicrobiota bacterium]HRU93473.1 hypothetical protein [Candidatus Neomarinimicrobiota bacterium]
MKKILIGFLLVTILIDSGMASTGLSQCGASWLLNPVSPTLNGMGQIGVCLPSDDIYAGYFNPANGIYGYRGLSFSFSKYKTDWLPNLVSDMFLNHSVIGINLLPERLPLQVTFSRYKTTFDLGKYIYMDEYGNEIYRHHPILTADAYSVAPRYRASLLKIPIDLSVGLTRKKVIQEYGLGDSSKSQNVFYDAGVLLSLPFKLNSSNGIGLNITPAFGYSISNIGKYIYFRSVEFADPSPRYARVGVSLSMNLTLDNDWNLVGYRQGRMAGDALFIPQTDDDSPFRYQSGIGDINFIKNVLDYQGSEEVDVSWGQEIMFIDFFAYRWGRFLELSSYSNEHERSMGYSFYSSGLLRLIGQFYRNKVIDLLSDHLAISYNYAKLINDNDWNEKMETEYRSWSIVLKNIEQLFKPDKIKTKAIIRRDNPFTAVAGINISDIRFAEKEWQEKVVKRKSGYKIGFEARYRWFVSGIAIDQRGANYLFEATIDPDIHVFDFNIIDSYNYTSFYGLLSVPVIKRVRVFGGLEVGDCISRKATLKIESGELSDEEIEETKDIPPTNLNWDYGLKAGLDLMIFRSFGLRAAYYHGFNYIFDKTDVIDFLPNRKHRNIEFSLIYKL